MLCLYVEIFNPLVQSIQRIMSLYCVTSSIVPERLPRQGSSLLPLIKLAPCSKPQTNIPFVIDTRYHLVQELRCSPCAALRPTLDSGSHGLYSREHTQKNLCRKKLTNTNMYYVRGWDFFMNFHMVPRHRGHGRFWKMNDSEILRMFLVLFTPRTMGQWT